MCFIALLLRYTLSTESFWLLTLEARLKWGIPFFAQYEPHCSALAPWRYRPGCCVVTGPVPHTLVMRFTRLNCRPISQISQEETISIPPPWVEASQVYPVQGKLIVPGDLSSPLCARLSQGIYQGKGYMNRCSCGSSILQSQPM